MANPILSERLQRVGKRHLKRLINRVFRSEGPSRPVYVLGYGRSGTTMLIDAMEHDLRIEVYGENDPRIASNFELVWDRLATAIQSCSAPLAMMKPILNSFDIRPLLATSSEAKVIWMLRDVDPVVRSALRKFGNGVAELLRRLVCEDDRDSWLGRGMPQSILLSLRSMDHRGFSTEDWMALVWWSVNSTMLDADLAHHPRVRLISYEALVASPAPILGDLYDWLGLPRRISAARWIGQPTMKKSTLESFNPDVRQRCTQLQEQLESLYRIRSGNPAARIETSHPQRALPLSSHQ